MSATAQRIAELSRRRAVLALLFFAPGQTQPVRALRMDLDTTHGLVATTDQVRADLQWLAEAGMVLSAQDVATITERGRDVITGATKLPGEA